MKLNYKMKVSLGKCKHHLKNYRFNGDVNTHNLYQALESILEAFEEFDALKEEVKK